MGLLPTGTLNGESLKLYVITLEKDMYGGQTETVEIGLGNLKSGKCFLKPEQKNVKILKQLSIWVWKW